jgi:hypothetical protein
MDGVIESLIREDDPRSAALRDNFVFKLVRFLVWQHSDGQLCVVWL